MAEVIGWLGAILLALCGAPQAMKSLREGHSRGVSPSFLALWLGGELCFLYSTVAELGVVTWLVFNYAGNIVFLIVIIYYAVFPRVGEARQPAAEAEE